jgi:DNA replication protein DnaC
MLAHPTHERLISLGLSGMAKAFEDQRRSPDIAALSFEERIGMMVDREAAERDTKRLVTRLKFAALRQNAVVEDVDLRTPRGIDRALFQKLVVGDWIERAEGLLITGPTGVGKSWIACALGHKACRDGKSVLYHRIPRLLEALALARGDRAIAFQNWASSLERNASFHPACLIFPRSEPFDPSFCIAFNAMWRRIARFSGPLPRRVRS